MADDCEMTPLATVHAACAAERRMAERSERVPVQADEYVVRQLMLD